MRTIDEITDREIIAILRNALAECSGEKEAKRKARARKAKADFFNLNEVVKNNEIIVF